MIAWYWLIVAFWLGGMLGFMACAVLSIGRDPPAPPVREHMERELS